MTNPQYQIVYFPYLCMKGINEIDFGFIRIWNFSKCKNKYIKDTNVIDKITKILSCYKDYNRSIIDEIGVVSIGDTDFRVLNERELSLIKESRYLLFLSFLSQNNTCKYNCNSGHKMVTSDNFDVIYQNFILENDYVSEKVGEIINFSKGGYKLDGIIYQRPSFVPTPMNFEADNQLFLNLIDLRNRKPAVYKRILSATEIFFESYYNSHYVSRNARILLQVSAFEIILQLPVNAPRKEFRNRIGVISNNSSDKKYSYNIKFWSKNKIMSVKGLLTLKEIWADQFFSLRNKIIHGEGVRPGDFVFKHAQRHYDISLLFFILTIKKQIEKSLKNNKYSCDYGISWKSWVDEISQLHPVTQVGFVYEHSRDKLLEKLIKKAKK